MQVHVGDDLSIKVCDKDTLSADELIGQCKIPVYEAAEATSNGVKGMIDKEYPLGDSDAGTIHLKLRFLAFF